MKEKETEKEYINTLQDTVNYMLSNDYKERFIAEYWQTKFRYERLKNFCNKIEVSFYSKNVEEPEHDCSYELLRTQQTAMGEYLHILELRAIIEDIKL